MLGVIERTAKKHGRAIACFHTGLRLAPDSPSLWSNLGNALNDVKHCESAVACHRRAVALNPGDATAKYNLGIALTAAGRDREAITEYDRALEIRPGQPQYRFDRAMSRLRIGELAAGWQDYEARQQIGKIPDRQMPGQRWTGERYDGKRLLVVAEQGIGDTIWVSRYFRRVKELGGELIIECRPEVIPLVSSLEAADRIVVKRDPLPEADYHILQCSLPGLFDDIPACPYLTAPADHGRKIAAMLPADGRKLKVGIIWGGSVTYDRRGERDASLRMFLQWFSLPHVQLYSLQKGPQADDLKALPSGAPVIDLAPHTADLAETAAAVTQLDLIIMTDTAVAHLAGALGKPVWLLLCRVPQWLWQQDRSDTPWYPSMRLFRQKSWGDWRSAFDQAAAALFAIQPGSR
jgi:hypothetical protein